MMLFDRNWHKLHMAVSKNRLDLFVDCLSIGSVALRTRGQVDTLGETLIGRKFSAGGGPVQVISIIFFDLKSGGEGRGRGEGRGEERGEGRG